MPEKSRHKKPPDRNSSLQDTFKELEPYLGIGITFTVSILVMLFFGRWLDRQLGTGPWLLITGAALGLIFGFIHMFSTLNSLQQNGKSDRNSEEHDAE